MSKRNPNRIHALLFGLSEDLAGELLRPLAMFCDDVQSVRKERTRQSISDIANSSAQIIFCGADVSVVNELKTAKPDASIVVVSRHPEVSDWLDSIEAGASDYCAAPFETQQVQWILESSMRSQQLTA